MLMRLQIANDLSRIVQNLLDKGHHFTSLDLDKVAILINYIKTFFEIKNQPFTLLRNLDKRITRHILDTIVRLVHKLE